MNWSSPNANIGKVIKGKKIVAMVNPMPFPNFSKNSFKAMIEKMMFAMGTKINPAITNLYTFALFAIIPFNIVKCGLNAIVTALVYKHVSAIIHSGIHREKKTETIQ